ncbi:MAG TPA: ribokinase [Ktedonobacterales bacterium]|nr:ribokinase [Ktedonobacterales bacterium]
MTHLGGGVVVLASFILDLVARVPRRPLPGESIVGSDFGMFAGGKGNNQAIAAARSGADVRVIGRLGEDVFAAPFVAALAREGIDARSVARDAEAGTGLAFPLIEPDGQNSIVVLPRANLALRPEHVRTAAAAFDGAAVLLAQLEVPVETAAAAAEMARDRGMRVLLNPAPAPADGLPGHLLRLVDVLVPNEREAETLSGVAVRDAAGAERAARALIAAGCRQVVVTLGRAGAVWVAGQDQPAIWLPPFAVEQVDATGAGDAFCGVLAAGLAAGMNERVALRRASAAGALAVTRMGAEPSMPVAAAIDALLSRQAAGEWDRPG